MQLKIQKYLFDIQTLIDSIHEYRIIHAYDSVDNEIILGIVINYLPKLIEDIISLLE
jgi:uncharacterized protein with HEPN domain